MNKTTLPTRLAYEIEVSTQSNIERKDTHRRNGMIFDNN